MSNQDMILPKDVNCTLVGIVTSGEFDGGHIYFSISDGRCESVNVNGGQFKECRKLVLTLEAGEFAKVEIEARPSSFYEPTE